MVTILTIEDNPAIRSQIVSMLGFEGYDVAEAENGIEGLAIMRRSTPDVILCDVMMPGMDGYEVLRHVRAEGAWATLPFIFLTARAERNDMRAAMENGADDYVVKPFSTDELLGAVQAALVKRAHAVRESEVKLSHLGERICGSLPHELRTPLNIVMGYAELLAEANPAQISDVRGFGQAILRAGQRLHRLTENFLLYVQFEALDRSTAGDALQLYTRIEARAVIEQAAREKATHTGRLPDLNLDLGSDAAWVNAIHLGKVVDELVDNAFKFDTPGSPVKVSLRQRGDTATLTIADRGRGMSADQVAATQAFVQFDRILHEQQGMGLGIAIAKRLVTLSGGTLSIDSTPGAGTTVAITLPAVHAAAEPSDLDTAAA